MINLEELERRARLYATRHGRTILEARLGTGTDGTVWQTTVPSAIKVSERERSHSNERDSYLRLREHGVKTVCGCKVPQLIKFDDELMIVEMDIIKPPCILDFGKAYIDQRPPYDADQLAEYAQEQAELWGDDIKAVRAIQAKLRSYGIHYLDAKPANIILRPGPIRLTT